MYYLFILSALLSAYGYRIYRKLPVKVNCWFCGDVTRVPPGNSNCWDCPHCEQYNGFKPNGDYNKPIPAQYDEMLNVPITSVQNCKKFPSFNGLCRKCNNYEAVKVKLLSTFIPLNQSNFNSEVDDYKQHLEKLYPLCQRCLLYVQKKLETIHERLLQTSPNVCLSSKSCAKELKVKKPLLFCIPIVAHLCAVACLCVLLPSTVGQLSWLHNYLSSFLPSSQPLVVIGFLLSLLAAAFSQRPQWYLTDAFEILMWILVQFSFSSLIVTEHLWMKFAKPFVLLLSIVLSIVNIFKRYIENKALISRYKIKRVSSTSENLPKTLFNIHITPPKQMVSSDAVENPFKRKSSNILSPQRFSYHPITKASWVAGGFWSATANYSKQRNIHFVSSSFLTPPPSVNGSQASQAYSQSGSFIADDLDCGTCTCGSTISSYSYSSSRADKGSNTDVEIPRPSQASSKEKSGRFLLFIVAGLSLMANVVFVIYMYNN